LSIAGSDSGGGAGIQADIKTIHSLGAHALIAVTSVTAQNSLGIRAIHEVPAKFISIQIETLLDDLFPDAVKIGMLFTGAAVRAVAGCLKKNSVENIVIDPVMRASTGRLLLEEGALQDFRDRLLPLATVVAPNLEEAGILTGRSVENLEQMKEASKEIQKSCPHVIITGGHLEGECTDLLYDGTGYHAFRGPKLETGFTHGSGCVFSAALATYLALGRDVRDAAGLSHDFTRKGIARGYACGRGAGVLRTM
jgi:hydroxymethylpyrimidine/phosphomethylpyrimidine kinase